jgi:hypothetical protein
MCDLYICFSTVLDPNEILAIGVWHDDKSKDVFLGTCEIPLPAEVKNAQNMQMLEYVLLDQEGRETNSSLIAGIQFFNDPVKLTESKIKAKEAEKKSLQDELGYISETVRLLLGNEFLINCRSI